ncbi:hypothetical protein D3C81_1098330 [compost metagenome]
MLTWLTMPPGATCPYITADGPLSTSTRSRFQLSTMVRFHWLPCGARIPSTVTLLDQLPASKPRMRKSSTRLSMPLLSRVTPAT